MALCASGGGFSLTPEQLDEAAATARQQRALPPRYRTGYYTPSGFRHVKLTEYPIDQRCWLPDREPVLRPPDPDVADYWRERDAEMLAWEDSVRRRWHV